MTDVSMLGVQGFRFERMTIWRKRQVFLNNMGSEANHKAQNYWNSHFSRVFYWSTAGTV